MTFEQMSGWLDELSVLVEAKNVHGLVTKLVDDCARVLAEPGDYFAGRH